MAVWCSNADAKQQRDTHRALNPICCHLRPGQVLNALYTFASTRVLVQGRKHLIARASAYAPVIKPSNLSRLAKWSPIRSIPCTAPSDGATTCEGNQACSGSAQGLIWMARTPPKFSTACMPRAKLAKPTAVCMAIENCSLFLK